MTRAATHTRYVSPFGSPATIDRPQAERLRRQDSALYRLMRDVGILTEQQRRIGAPRLDDDVFRYADLPVWRQPEGDRFELIRELVRDAERGFRDRGERYVVAERAEGLAALPARLLMPDDVVVWETAR